jgi:hypothetical protein
MKEFIELNCSGSSTYLIIEGKTFGYLPELAPQTLEMFQVIGITSTIN